MTDLRDQLPAFEAAAQRALDHRRPKPVTLADVHRLGPMLRRLRHDAGLTLDQVGAAAHVTRNAISNRELRGSALPAAALVEHLAALGYDLALIPHTDRRTAP